MRVKTTTLYKNAGFTLGNVVKITLRRCKEDGTVIDEKFVLKPHQIEKWSKGNEPQSD